MGRERSLKGEEFEVEEDRKWKRVGGETDGGGGRTQTVRKTRMWEQFGGERIFTVQDVLVVGESKS